MICLYHGAIIYVCNSALSSYIHITTVEVVQSNEPWRMSAGCRRSCCTLMTPSSEYEELRSSLTWILQSLILPAKKHEIPGYDTYKTSFACCDDFNKGLHDKPWRYGRTSVVEVVTKDLKARSTTLLWPLCWRIHITLGIKLPEPPPTRFHSNYSVALWQISFGSSSATMHPSIIKDQRGFNSVNI